MTIRQYEEEGMTLYKVYICVRSPRNNSFRVQKNRKNIRTMEEAVREEKKLKKQALYEVDGLEQSGDTWGRIIDLWYHDQTRFGLSNRYTNKFTVEDYDSMLRRHTKDWLKLRTLEITRGDGRRVIEDLQSLGKSRSFISKVKNTINFVFQWGIDHGHIKGATVSPVYGIKLEKRDDVFKEILTLTEIRKFLCEAKRHEHPWYPVWAMALLTGMRSGELYALEWNDVDFEKQVIRVSKSYSARLKKVKDTKSGYWRNVPISEELNGLLVELKSKTGHLPNVLPKSVQWARGEQAKGLRIFLKSIGLPAVKFHTLRACFATQLLSEGVEMTKVMKIGGWKDIKTMQIYLRLAGVEERGATDTLRFLPSDEAVMEHVGDLLKFR